VQQGKVVYVGSSNFAGWHVARACETARARNALGIVSEQTLYSLVDRTVELEVLPACLAYGVGVLPWSPLGGGILGGALAKAKEGRRATESVQKKLEKHRAKLEPWEQLCRDLGEQPADVALAWLLANPAVTAPIVGPRTRAQLDGAVRALELAITPEIGKRLDELFPGPGGAAPEAYAW
jgi:aryl-alcohol dehydrogenase-like predicted oxidoreductase